MEDAVTLLQSAPPLHAGVFARPLQQRAVRILGDPLSDLVVGDLIALTDDGRTSLVRLSDQPGGMALPASSIVDLHAGDIGPAMLISLQGGDPALPTVMGLLNCVRSQVPELPGLVEVDADGARLLVAADEQVVRRRGRANVTLTMAGKVVVEGRCLSSKSSGANCTKGGSLQLN
jgi:hypothetical protein